jgi:hypothetical protein
MHGGKRHVNKPPLAHVLIDVRIDGLQLAQQEVFALVQALSSPRSFSFLTWEAMTSLRRCTSLARLPVMASEVVDEQTQNGAGLEVHAGVVDRAAIALSLENLVCTTAGQRPSDRTGCTPVEP